MTGRVEGGRPTWPWIGAGLLLLAGALILLWGLNMRRGLNHDEHQFVASAALLARNGLLPYRDFPYFHVPLLTFIYAFLFQFTPYLLLAARAFSVVSSSLLLALLLVVAFTWPRNLAWGERLAAGLIAVVLLMASPSFVHASGRAWNHDLPVLLTSLAAILFGWWLAGGQLRSLWWLLPVGLLLGLAAAARSSFVLAAPAFALALLWFAGWRCRRAWLGISSLILGGLLGAAPALYLFALAPERFLFGNLTYAALNTAYYAQLAAPPPAMTLPGKLLTAAQLIVWQPGNLLLVVLVAVTLWLVRRSLRPTVAPELLFALLLLPFLIAGAFAPTPLQEQYIYPLFPWCALTWLVALRHVGNARRLLVAAGAAALLAALLVAPRYAEGAEVALQPDEWNPLKVHARGERLVQLAGGQQVLTLAPIFALEGGSSVYPELVSGPLAFRVASLLPPEVRSKMGLVGPEDLPSMLPGPPRSIFTGVHDSDSVEEEPLVAYAGSHGYVPVPEEDAAVLWSQPLANWGDAVHLGTLDLPLQPVVPGSELLLTLYLQALQPLDRNWNVLVRLVAPDGTTDLARSEGWPWGRPTMEWKPGEVWPDGHTMVIPGDATPGPYRVEVSFYDAQTLDLLGGGPATIGYVVVADPAAKPGPMVPLAHFGKCIELLGVDVPQDRWAGGTVQTVQLKWQRTSATCGRYTMFVHLAGPQGLAAQRDQELLQGFYPTNAWLPLAPVSDRYALELPAGLATGDYQLLVGLYDPVTGERLPVVQNGEIVGDAYPAATIQVAASQ